MSDDKASDRRARAEQMRKQRERAQRRRRNLITGGIVVAVVVLIAVAAFAINTATDDDGSSTTPGNVTSDGGIVYDREAATGEASDGDPVEVVVYEDFQCPICKAFEAASGDFLDQQVEAGTITVTYHPIAILDGNSADRYSTRSLNAAACVVDDGGAKAFHDFKDLLYAHQPEEGGPGLTTDELAGYAGDAGVPGARDCIDDLTYEDWAAKVTRKAAEAGVTSTPTVLIGGEQVKDVRPQGLRAAIKRSRES